MTAESRLALHPVPASAAQARDFVVRTLARWGCQELADPARLLVSELVTNAVLHARTDMSLVVRQTRHGVRIEVHDGSQVTPASRPYPDDAMTGRGLSLVSMLSDRWGVERDTGGKAVWFEIGA